MADDVKVPEILPGPTCHSCGMLIMKTEEFAIESNYVINTNYCRYCYWKGKFTEPDITREQMIEKLAQAMKINNNMSDKDAAEMAKNRLKLLKRWQEK